MTLRVVACQSNVDCGQPHPAYDTCDTCRGHGFYQGGDEYQPCPTCGPRFRREYGTFVEALAELPTEAAIAKERAIERALDGWD